MRYLAVHLSNCMSEDYDIRVLSHVTISYNFLLTIPFPVYSPLERTALDMRSEATNLKPRVNNIMAITNPIWIWSIQ
jgi:hypothetical protein